MASASAQSHPFTTFNISGLSREDAYSQISAEILRLKDQIRSLYSLQNSLAPVSCLPNELLSNIFMHSCDLEESGEFTNFRPERRHDDDEDEDGKASLNTRLTVSWVSRHWRHVALGHKPLWNLVFGTVDTPDPDYARVCTERCQSLYIDAYSPTPSAFQFYMSHISQISYLKLKGPFQVSVDFSWPQAAPLLRSLSLRSRTPASISDGITHATCPQLRSLKLNQHPVDWDFPFRVASTITDLSISWPDSQITTTRFVHLLEAMQLLTKCEISLCLEYVPDDPSSPLRHIYLPQLREMIIYESTAAITQLLSKISAPAASLHLTLAQHDGNTSNSDVQRLFHTLRETQGHVWNPVHHLQHRFDLTIFGSSLSPKHAISCAFLIEFPDELLLACRHLDLDNLESLWTKSACIEDMVKLSSLPRLSRIAFETLRPLKTFIIFMRSSTTNRHSTLLFPELRELILFNLDSGDMLEELYSILTARKISGVGLQRLEFVECESVGLGNVFRFKKVVDQVEISDTIRHHPALLDPNSF
ncbi:hypothetical protein BDN72DRAFT_846696 [Pluteus cervinus]|uniref:Uncharacterized protein n=1 Tax=Pluteus cervinus TaxID=181527 RepID=A0ACD3AFB1_9AGAR|nr:hypothetical protein BDN72DRAFT_846696 [Pluteus cervinus]